MPPSNRFSHRLNVFLGDFDRAILAHAVARDPAINYSDVIRDALRYYAWHHPGFDPQGFEQLIAHHRKTIHAPSPHKRKRADDGKKKRRYRARPPTEEERLAAALRLFDDEAAIYRRGQLLPTMPEPALPIESDFAPIEDVGDLQRVASDFSRDDSSSPFDENAAYGPGVAEAFAGGLSGFSSDTFSREDK